MTSFQMPMRPCPGLLCSSRIIALPSNTFEDLALSGKKPQVPLRRWPFTWWAGLHRVMMELLFRVERSVIVVVLKQSGISLADVGRRASGASLVGKKHGMTLLPLRFLW